MSECLIKPESDAIIAVCCVALHTAACMYGMYVWHVRRMSFANVRPFLSGCYPLYGVESVDACQAAVFVCP